MSPSNCKTVTTRPDSAEIAPEALVHPTAVIGENVKVHSFAYVGEGANIGKGTIIGPGAVIMRNCQIGQDCVIAPEAVLGSRGFGYVFDGKQHLRIPQVGRVSIGDNSEIGPATCIDRAAMDVTSVGEGCKLGAMIQVAHNCQLGKDCQIGSGSGLAGSTKLGSGVKFGKRVGSLGHSTYGDNAMLDDLTGVTRAKIPANTHWSGYPARLVKKKV